MWRKRPFVRGNFSPPKSKQQSWRLLISLVLPGIDHITCVVPRSVLLGVEMLNSRDGKFHLSNLQKQCHWSNLKPSSTCHRVSCCPLLLSEMYKFFIFADRQGPRIAARVLSRSEWSWAERMWVAHEIAPNSPLAAGYAVFQVRRQCHHFRK